MVKAPQVVISPATVAVIDGGGGATTQVVISPARADRDSTKSNVIAAESFRKLFICSPEVDGWLVGNSEGPFPNNALNAAIATLNRMKTEKEAVRSVLVKPTLLRIKSYTVLNGTEMTTTNDATIESIDFNEVRLLVIQDYMQSRLAANKIEQPLQRASYLTAVATTALKAQSRSPLTTSKN